MQKNKRKQMGKIDWLITLVPLAIIIILCLVFFFAPVQSNEVLSEIRFFFGDTLGSYYLIIGLGIFCCQYILRDQNTEILYWEPLMRSLSILFLHGDL